MNLFYQKILILLTIVSSSVLNANAVINDSFPNEENTIEINNIYYKLNSDAGTASVTYRGSITGAGTTTNYQLDFEYYQGDITIPNKIYYDDKAYTVTSIGRCAFYHSSLLKSVTLPNEIKEIGLSAFNGCEALETVSLTEGLESIRNAAFWECKSLINITLPSSLLVIESFAFYKCESLTSIVIPDNVSKIEDSAFARCTNIKSVILGKSYTSINPRSIFTGCTAIKAYNVHFDNMEYSSLDGVLFNKDKTTLLLYPQGKHGDYVIPSTVDTVAYAAFLNCRQLTGITIPASVIDIAGDGHYNSATIQEQGNPFLGCNSLERIVVESANTVYDSRNNCNAIIRTGSNTLVTGCKNTVIPNSITTIGSFAFYQCSELTTINLPNGINAIGYGAYEGCTSLTSINIPNNVKEIRGNAFRNCIGLVSVEIPDGVVVIESNTFEGCMSLTSIKLPNSITNIGSNVFVGCTSLTAPVYNNHVFAFMPTSHKGDYAIPAGITNVAGGAFFGCIGLTSISIPFSVKYIGYGAFSECAELTDIFNYAIDPPSISYNTFTNYSATLHIVHGCLNAYKSDNYRNYWKNFQNIVEDLYATSGYCGENAIYTLDIDTGVLYITGTGSMKDYSYRDYAPWYSNRDYIKSVIIAGGITSIGDCAFYECSRLDSVYIPSSVVRIGNNAFFHCNGLKEIELPDDIKAIGYSAFPNIPIYSNRGSITLLALWSGEYTPFEKENNIKLEAPYLSLLSVTQTTVNFKVNNYYEEYSYAYKCYSIDYEYHSFNGNEEIKITGLKPNCSSTIYLKVSLSGINYESHFDFSTKSLSISLKEKGCTASSILISGSYKHGDAIIDKEEIACCYRKNSQYKDDSAYYSEYNPNAKYRDEYYWNYYLAEGTEVTEGNLTLFKGLNPSTGYYFVFAIYVGSTPYYGVSFFCTNDLLLTTKQPKVVSSGNAIVAATSNLDEEEINVGFEWRRTDWTDDFESNKGGAYLFEGNMEGYIRNLNTEKLWKFRPYYTSNSGKTYYGDWVGLDPTNTSYFEPTVHTYAKVSVQGNTAEVKGYAMRGSDNVTSQGFMYWKASNGARAEAGSSNVTVPKDATTVEVKGNMMTTTLEGLDYESTYCYVAFVTTSEGETFYGEQQTFTTGVDTSGIETYTAKVNDSRTMIYDIKGRRLNALQRGINIIRMSNGTTKKVFVK